MRVRRKTSKCLNCGYSLDEVYNYCPGCGQENTNNNVSFYKFLGDFISNYFSFDSRFWRSIKPFFLQPGYLTDRFNEGKRNSYISPLRLYLVISLIYFFIISIVIQRFASEIEKDSFQSSGKSEALIITDSLIKEKSIAESLSSIDSLSEKDMKLAKASIKIDSLNKALKKGAPINEKKNKEEGNFDFFIKYRNDKSISHSMMYDSLNLNIQDPSLEQFTKKLIKAGRSDFEYIFSYIVKNLPVMMFILLPIFALILKVLYVRKKMFYIQHIIHALHLHSFAYFFYGLGIILLLTVPQEWNIHWMIFILSFMIVSVYAYLSLKNVYQQRKLKTFIKFMLLGWIYSWLLLIFFIAEIFISIALF
jgi:hypothetical protein